MEKSDFQSDTGKVRRGKASQPRLTRRMLRTRDASEYLGISAWTLRRLMHRGEIPFIQNGQGSATLDIRDLDAYIDGNKRVG